MSTLRSSLFALGLVWLAVTPPAASLRQDPPAATLRVDSRLVTLDILVLERRTGERVQGLRHEDFEVLDDGRPVELTHFGNDSGASRPLADLRERRERLAEEADRLRERLAALEQQEQEEQRRAALPRDSRGVLP
jgi:hypothetical protein